MRLRPSHILTNCVLPLLLLSYGKALAQSAQAVPLTYKEDSAKTAPAVTKLQDLIEEAMEQNPEIKVMRRGFDMMRARIPQAKALPEPMLNVGYMGNVVPIPPFDIQKGDPSSGRVFGFTQEIPFPGKLAIKG